MHRKSSKEERKDRRKSMLSLYEMVNTKGAPWEFYREYKQSKERLISYNSGGKLLCIHVWCSCPVVFTRLRV